MEFLDTTLIKKFESLDISGFKNPCKKNPQNKKTWVFPWDFVERKNRSKIPDKNSSLSSETPTKNAVQEFHKIDCPPESIIEQY